MLLEYKVEQFRKTFLKFWKSCFWIFFFDPIWILYGPERLTFSDIHGPLALRETQGPMAPDTFSSLDVLTSSVPPKAMRNSPL